MTFDYSDWEKPVIKSSSNWTRAEVKLRDEAALKEAANDIWNGFESYVQKFLLEKWPEPDDGQEAAEEN